MKYPATLKYAQDTGGYEVTFRDIPEAITCGDDLDDALDMAADALLVCMDFYFDNKRPVPLPSKPKKGEYLIELPLSISAKVLLLNEMLNQKVRPIDLAKKLDAKPQEINRLVDLHHTTKIDRISDAMRALGKDLELVVG